MNRADTVGILLAAGSSARMGQCKLTLPLYKNKTAVELCLDAFASAGINRIAVTVSDATYDYVMAASKAYNTDISIVFGGNTRTESVRKALDCYADEAALVVIHDCARCLVTKEIINGCVDAARKHGNAIAAKRIVDTVRSMRSGTAYDRDDLVAVQTPQVFDLRVIKAAYSSSMCNATDDCELFMQSGGVPNYVMTDSCNDKLTYPFDIELFSAILKIRESDGIE